MDAAAKFRVSYLFTKIATLRHNMEFAKTGSTDITAYALIWNSVTCKQLKDISLPKIPERFSQTLHFYSTQVQEPNFLGGLANNGIVFIMVARPHELWRKFLMRN